MTRSRFKTAILLPLAALLAGCVAVPVPVSVARITTPAAQSPSLPPDSFGAALNSYRAENGRSALRRSPLLERVARVHAQDMARNGFMAHRGSDGSNPKRRLQRAGYGVCAGGENIAIGQRSAGNALQWWVNSPPHRKNMLLGGVREYGLARAEGNVWVLVVGRQGC